jgi:serine/threonine-protein kinase
MQQGILFPQQFMRKSSNSTANFIKRLLGADPFLGTDIVSDQMRSYRLTEKIGEGGMGAIYKAVDSGGKEVAVKVTTLEQGIARFKLEIAVLKLLGQHPNIPELFDWGLEKAEVKFCVMEYVPGDSLDKIIRKQSEWFYEHPLWHTLDIAIGILSALSHAHRKKVLHRDIKPHNIIVARLADGKKIVKLMDFGVAKTLEKGFLSFLHRKIPFAEKTLTLPGQPIGTLGYAPREQLDNTYIDESADIFACGITLLELLRGDFLLVGGMLSEYLRQLENFQFEPVEFPGQSEYVVGRLNQILQKAVAKDPKSRYRRADTMLKELQPLHRQVAKTIVK